VTESVTTSRKEQALDELRLWLKWSRRRDELVCEAIRAGNSWREVRAASGLAKDTLSKIVQAAGLTGGQPLSQESAVVADYRHHPHFVSVQRSTDGSADERYVWNFRPFTGREIDMQNPVEFPPDVDNNRVAYNTWRMAESEYRSARELRLKAAYLNGMADAVTAAAPQWRKYSTARSAVDDAWAALPKAPRPELAVLELLNIHAEAVKQAEEWDRWAREIAELNAQRPDDINLDWADIAINKQVDDAEAIKAWDVRMESNYRIGYYGGHGAADDLKKVIEDQRSRLKEAKLLTVEKR